METPCIPCLLLFTLALAIQILPLYSCSYISYIHSSLNGCQNMQLLPPQYCEDLPSLSVKVIKRLSHFRIPVNHVGNDGVSQQLPFDLLE